MKLVGGKVELDSMKDIWDKRGGVGDNVVNDNSVSKIEKGKGEKGEGGNAKSCPICLAHFGTLSNRKHLCHHTNKFYCGDCSSKRIILNGNSEELRVWDGSFVVLMSTRRRNECER